MAPTPYRTGPASAYKPSSSRYVGIGFVVAFHIVLLWALLFALGRRDVELGPQDIQATEIKTEKPKDELPPPPPPKDVIPPPPFVPPPEVNIQAPVQATTAIQTVTNVVPTKPAPVAAPPPPPAPVQTVPPHSLAGYKVNTDSCYPAISRRLQEEGVVALQILIGTDGRVADVKVGKSSGYNRLDQAAMECVRSQGRFAPGMADGKPVQAWANEAYRFQMR